MGGRSRRGPAFAASPFTSRPAGALPSRRATQYTAGLGAPAYLAYKAYQEYPEEQPEQAGGGTAGLPAPADRHRARGLGTPSRREPAVTGERIGDILGMGSEPAPEPEPAALDDTHAILLIGDDRGCQR